MTYPEQPCDERDCAGPDCPNDWCAGFWSKRRPLIALTEALRVGTPMEGVPGWSNRRPPPRRRLVVTIELDVPAAFDEGAVMDDSEWVLNGDPPARPLAEQLGLYLGAAVEGLYNRDVADDGIAVRDVTVHEYRRGTH